MTNIIKTVLRKNAKTEIAKRYEFSYHLMKSLFVPNSCRNSVNVNNSLSYLIMHTSSQERDIYCSGYPY